MSLDDVAVQATLADAHQRVRHAEEVASKFIAGHPSLDDLVNIVSKHMAERAADRAVHFEAVINSTAISINTLNRSIDNLTKDEIKSQLVGIARALALTQQR